MKFGYLFHLALMVLSLTGFALQGAVKTVDQMVILAEGDSKDSGSSLPGYRLAQQLLPNSLQQNDAVLLNKSNSERAEFHKKNGQLDSAFYYLNLEKEFYKQTEELEKLAKTHLKLEEIHNAKAQYYESMKQVYKALELYETLRDRQGIARCYAHLCNLLYYENKYIESVNYCDKAIAIQKKIQEPYDLALSYNYKASSQLFSGADLEDALSTVNKSIHIYRQEGEKGLPLMSSMNGRGNILKYMKRYDEAIADYQDNFDQSKRQGIDRYLIPSLGNIGHVYLLQKKYEEALPFILQAIELIKATGQTKNLWENYMHVSAIYKAMGNPEKALEYNILYSDQYAEYLNTIIERLESEAQIKYETGQKNAIIVLQNEQIAQQKKTQILYISIAGLLVLIVFGLFFYYKKRQRKNRELQSLNTELDSKNRQNELLLKEVHHRVKNNLELVKSLIALQTAQLEDSVTKDAMIASQNRVQSMGIIHQKLYLSANLGNIEMKDYFINLAESILDIYNAEDKVKIECDMEDLELDVDTAVPIGLIVNELLTNALKYAFPQEGKGIIRISLKRSDSAMLVLKVADNGIGKIKSIEKGTGFGSQLIHLLTQQLNGKMNEVTADGTSVFFQFKINAAA